MSALVASDIGVAVRGRTILAGADLRVAGGEVLGLLGPNGAGKTTLLKAVAGLIDARGTVTLDGYDLLGASPAERARRIAYLPQGAAAQWPMPVESVVALGRLPYQGRFQGPGRADRAAIARAMAETDIAPLAGRAVCTLSGGERARVLLARALAVEAPVLLADEPVAFLDPGHQIAVLDLLRHRAQTGDAVVVVLHDLSLAARLCHRVTVLDQGQVIADGPPEVVLDDALLDRVYGVRPVRGVRDGQPYLLPWEGTRP